MKSDIKNHWNWIHKNRSFNFIKKMPIFEWLQNYQFYWYITRFKKKSYTSIFEVGCAPGNYLINSHKKFWLTPYGIEYSEEGAKKMFENFKTNKIDRSGLIQWDFFDNKFLENNKEKYDIVYSIGFIEHFEDTKPVVERHFELVKKWWLVIMCIPNVRYVNRYLTPKKIVDLHNTSIMDIKVLKKILEWHKILKICYTWGLFNWWLFFYENRFLEKIRFLLFIIQRLIFDPILILLYIIWINLSNKYTSPQIIIIARKEE